MNIKDCDFRYITNLGFQNPTSRSLDNCRLGLETRIHFQPLNINDSGFIRFYKGYASVPRNKRKSWTVTYCRRAACKLDERLCLLPLEHAHRLKGFCS